MLQLLLSEPILDGDYGDAESYKRKKSLLSDLEGAIWSILSSKGRSEARLWLCSTLSTIRSISPHHQQELFVTLLRSKHLKQYLASQLLQLIFEKWPQKVGSIIAKKSQKLENFFKGSPKRISQWFSNFSGTGDLEHVKGAKALSQFAFVNRDICWEELEWKGKHGQSPAMVVTKPHYFLDLDVQRTVENFLEYVPEFWSSHEFSESLKDGDILVIDTRFFVNMFIDLMYEEVREVWKIVEDFLIEESFSFLCRHLLILLEEQDLHLFIGWIPKYLKPRIESLGIGDTSSWFEVILSKCGESSCIDQLLLLNALTTQGRKLLRLVKEEGSEEEKNTIKNLCFQVCESSRSVSDLVLLAEEDVDGRHLELIKRFGLQSWAIHSRLLEGFRTPESWESLFACNGIRFRRSNKYALLRDDEYADDCDEMSSLSQSLKPKKRRKHRKKRRLNLDPPGHCENEIMDVYLSTTTLNLQSEASDWLLSVDDYTKTWSAVDLPEHLSKHCFLTWVKWVFAR